MTNPSSESPTHPDAPRAGGETPTMDIDETRDLLLHAAEVLRCHAADQSTASGIDCGCADVAHRLDALRASLLERHRDGERIDALESWTKGDQTICPPGNHGGEDTHWLLARDDDAKGDRYGIWSETTEGPTLREAIDAAMSAPPSPERASAILATPPAASPEPTVNSNDR